MTVILKQILQQNADLSLVVHNQLLLFTCQFITTERQIVKMKQSRT